MKKILIIYTEMMVGGSTSSLISLLNELDYSKYSVDLALYKNKGLMLDKIPENVTVLPQLSLARSNRHERFLKSTNVLTLLRFFSALYKQFKSKNKLLKSQIMAHENTKFTRSINKKYDVAVAFLEGFPISYLARKTLADLKIGWIHVDYLKTGFDTKIDEKFLLSLDKICLVSSECKKNFDLLFPEMAFKTTYIENIVSPKLIIEKSIEYIPDINIDEEYINLLTVCRVDLNHKGIDRAVKALFEIGKIEELTIKWYIIGDGPDFDKLQTMIEERKLKDNIILLGVRLNPFPYFRLMDAFFLPSRYEGKPIVVTESLILGLPPIVTNYSSANEQIDDRVNGIIIENTDKAIYECLYNINSKQLNLRKFRDELQKKSKNSYGNIDDIYKLIDE